MPCRRTPLRRHMLSQDATRYADAADVTLRATHAADDAAGYAFARFCCFLSLQAAIFATLCAAAIRR